MRLATLGTAKKLHHSSVIESKQRNQSQAQVICSTDFTSARNGNTSLSAYTDNYIQLEAPAAR